MFMLKSKQIMKRNVLIITIIVNVLSLILSLVWMVASGFDYEPIIVSLGLILSLAVLFFNIRNSSFGKEERTSGVDGSTDNLDKSDPVKDEKLTANVIQTGEKSVSIGKNDGTVNIN